MEKWSDEEMDDAIDGILQVVPSEDATPQENTKEEEQARKGRRAKANVLDGPAEEPDAPADDVPLSTDMHEVTEERVSSGKKEKKGRRRMSGWGDTTNKGFDDDERFKKTHTPPPENDESDNDIPVIPDLEDSNIGDDSGGPQIAMAPNVAVNRVATYRELDNDLLKHAAFLTLDNEIDLKLLAKCLSSESEITEDQKLWEWDRLFTEVTSEMLSEWEENEEVAAS
ncbi:DgyrCDS5461 [Dimorphilus gyrociliatus]|uniref:DgyrCDS5461 n=1 Tax=Dimorphilus gyrociliatus TaxID=2664684 RepID=A0A7I8VLK8_9ANNE|nr:DgyrCDS5461 [Dimorphilus gyrociliatus]